MKVKKLTLHVYTDDIELVDLLKNLPSTAQVIPAPAPTRAENKKRKEVKNNGQ
jgi:hypothetical protein